MSDAADRLAAAIADRYRIERELGRGGMATVYLAEDLKHQRRVAIKVLHPELAAVIGAERFLAEIRTTAGLQHPHILPLHDSGAAGGFVFYVMPFVEGISLRQRLERDRQLPIDEAVGIGAQVAGALDYAHRRGVVHRDIKPENILLQDDQALVSDFGIALATHTSAGNRLTETGLSVGTPQYMSPEQALGDRDVDARSDLYALGVTLYEALTGTPPFTGPTAGAVIARILTETPVPPSQHRGDVPAHLDAAVMKALEREPQRRFDSAAAMNAALSRPASVEATSPTRATGKRRLQWALGGLALAAAVAAGWYAAAHAGPAPAHAAVVRAVTALPFQSFSADSTDAYLADGIPQDVLGNLASAPGLTVRPMPEDRRFRERPDPRSVAGELHVDIILTGSFLHQGDSIRVTVRPYDVHRDAMLPASTVVGASRSVFALEDSLSASIARSLGLPAARKGRTSVALRTRPENPAAHDTLMLARWYLEKRDCASLDRAVALFTSATRLDSTYALAWAGLADAHDLRGAFYCAQATSEFVPARAAVERALALDPNAAAAHSTLGFIHVFADWDWPAAAAEFQRSLQLDSTRAETWLYRTWYYVATHRLDSARLSIRRARDLDPSSSIIRTRVGTVLEQSDSLKAATIEFEEVLRHEPTFGAAAENLAPLYARTHQCEKALALVRDQPLLAPWFGDLIFVYARCGEAATARADLSSRERRLAGGEYLSAIQFAIAYAGLEDTDKMFHWLDRAVAERDWQLFMLASYQAFKPYRSDPRFQVILRQVHLTAPP